MNLDEQSERAQALVSQWLLREYRSTGNQHLHACPDATTSETDGGDGLYGCDTGCEYLRLETIISCPHGYSDGYIYGQFTDLDCVLDNLLRFADRGDG